MYGALLLAGLAVIGQAKAWLQGPDLRFLTVTRVKPVPVVTEQVKWLRGKTKVERVEVPVEVIRTVTPKVADRLREDFKLDLNTLRSEKKELVDVREVPKAPYGGEMALTVHTETGKVDTIFRPKPQPFLELGGLREAGVGYDPLNAAVRVYGRMDVGRVGPVVVNGEVFAVKPLRPGEKADFGGAINASVRF